MPTGYAGEGKTYSKKLGRWLKKETHSAFDYDGVDQESVAFLISFFRFYPDYFLDIFRSPTAEFKLEIPQRLILRAFARYRNVYITGARGLTKTHCVLLFSLANGILYPGEVMRYYAPNQKQAAALAAQAFHQIEKDYPALAGMWRIRNDRSDMFRVTTQYGSEFTMYAPRGSNSSMSIAEEIGAEGAEGFDMDAYEKDVLPTVRMERRVNQKQDDTHIDSRHLHISNACSKQNRAFTVHRYNALRDMVRGEPYEGFVLDLPWEVAVISNIRNKNYIKDQKKKLTVEDFQREMCARYTGTNENPLVTDEALTKSRKLMTMEDVHCGDPNAIYIVSHDVSYVDGVKNAKCADVVVKLTRYKSSGKRDKYRKQVVYVDCYPPPKTVFLQAQKVKALWLKYCMNGGETTYLVVDAQAVGTDVVIELMKPSGDGVPPLCCYKHMRFADIEQENALPVIYPLKAGVRGSTDEEGEMLRYSQVEFEQGNVELLTSAVMDGVEQYKRKHGIKDDFADARIIAPYKKTDELCQQVQNLTVKTSGISNKEERKSKAIQRDIWSALKYALRMARILEDELLKSNYRKKSSWTDAINQFNKGGGIAVVANNQPAQYGGIASAVNQQNHAMLNNQRSRLLSLRRVGRR